MMNTIAKRAKDIPPFIVMDVLEEAYAMTGWRLGISVAPTGAFYILGNIKKYSNDSYKMAFDILKRAHVAVAPGIDFGENCEGYLRFSYANSLENIREGMDRLQKYLREQS